MKMPAMTFSIVSWAAKATARPKIPSAATIPVTLMPSSLAAVSITRAHIATPAMRNMKFSSPSSNSVLSNSFLRYLLAILMRGMPMMIISSAETGPIPINSEAQA